MLLRVLLSGNFLLFADSASPEIDILDLLLLLAFESLLFALEQHLIVSHDFVVIEKFTSTFNIGNLDLAYLLNTSAGKLLKDFLCTDLTHHFQLFKKLVLLSLFLLLDLLHCERLLPLSLLCEKYVLQCSAFFSLGAGNLDLHLFHVFLAAEDLTHLLLHLFLDFHEDAFSFLPLACCFLDTSEGLSQFLAETEEVSLHFLLLVECHTLGLMVEHGLNETFSVAFEEKQLNGIERGVEPEKRLQGRKLEVLEIVAALLKDSHRESLLQEVPILRPQCQRIENLLSLLGNGEGRFFILD